MFRTNCHNIVVAHGHHRVVAERRSLDCVLCGRGQARASHTHGHYKVVARLAAQVER